MAQFIQRLPKLVSIKRFEVGQEIEYDGIARRDGVDFEQRLTARADEFSEFHPLGVGRRARWVDCVQCCGRVADVNEDFEFPVVATVTELVAAAGFYNSVGAFLNDEEMFPNWQQGALVPLDALLENFDVFEEAVGVFKGAHDRPSTQIQHLHPQYNDTIFDAHFVGG